MSKNAHVKEKQSACSYHSLRYIAERKYNNSIFGAAFHYNTNGCFFKTTQYFKPFPSKIVIITNFEGKGLTYRGI